MLEAGRLRHQVTIRRPVKEKDGKGGFSTSWINIGTPRAEVISLNGREALVDHVLQRQSFYRITMRWRDDVRADDQILFGNVELNVTSAEDTTGLREELVILAQTGGALKAG